MFGADDNGGKRIVHGTARDLSAGGICVVLTSDGNRFDLDSLIEPSVNLTILEGNRTAIDGLSGSVAWRKTVGNPAHPTHILGIVFDVMTEETAMALNAFCTISNDEQDMIWNLWNHLVRH